MQITEYTKVKVCPASGCEPIRTENSADFLKALFGSASCGVVLIDRDGRIHMANGAFERAFGLPSGGAAGKPSAELFRCTEEGRPLCECGNADDCTSCAALALAIDASLSEDLRSRTVNFGLSVNGNRQQVPLVLHSATILLGQEKYTVLVFENIGNLRAASSWAGGMDLHGIVARDPAMRQLFETIRQVGRLNVAVLIEGESGTGKELVAQALHLESARAGKPLVPVNCGALPHDLLASELFGHVRGAFTGAVRDTKGRFELAHGSTLFLDEIGDISPAMQVKLLRVLEDGSFQRVGGQETLKADFRVICATNKSLRREIQAARFRADLYYRLCVFRIEVPPLRERKGDLPVLVDHLLARAASDFGHRIPEVSPSTLEALSEHAWPGNVRELDNSLRHALILARGRSLEPHHLPASILRAKTAVAFGSSKPSLTPRRVTEALRSTGGNKTEAARWLGVGRATLYRYLSRLTESS